MSVSHVRARVTGSTPAAVRHFSHEVGETGDMHRVSDRAAWRARAQREWGHDADAQ
jgi:hypothetical protein